MGPITGGILLSGLFWVALAITVKAVDRRMRRKEGMAVKPWWKPEIL